MTEYESLVGGLAGHLVHAIKRSFPDVETTVIVNPAAGSTVRNISILEEVKDRLTTSISTEVLWTDAPGHARSVSERVVSSLSGAELRHVVVSIGGDGTHNEVCGPAILEHRKSGASTGSIAFLRVPLGSGNDGADAQTLRGLLGITDGLLERGNAPAVTIETKKRTVTALNIASFGLDAFVTVTRERLRHYLPGNGYKMVADAAVLFYEKLVDLQPGTITLDDGTVWTGEAMLAAFGASGNRTYGGHISVLPGPENVCLIKRSGIIDKLRLKKLFYDGQHVGHPLTQMFISDRITIDYPGTLHFQADGEGGTIDQSEFPIMVRRLPRAFSVLVPARIAGYANS